MTSDESESRDATNPRKFKMTWKRILLAVFAVSIFVVIALGLNLWWPFEIPVEISKEITHITSPLDKNGLPDYRQALNDMMKPDGVTPENNAAVLLWQAAGSNEDATPAWDDRFSQALGIDPLPEEGDYLVDLGTFAEMKAAEQAAAENTETDDETGNGIALSERLDDELDMVLEQPWQAKDHPLMLEWLEVNENPIQLALEAVERPHYYQPMVPSEIAGEPELLFFDTLPLYRPQRFLAQLLKTRAMLKLGEGRALAAQKELLAIHKLARFAISHPTITKHLLGFTLERIAYHGDQQLAFHGELSSQELLAYRRQLTERPPIADVMQCFEHGERMMTLDLIAQSAWGAASNNPDNLDLLFSVVENDSALRYLVQHTSFDWNEALRLTNETYDRAVEAGRLPRHQRKTSFSDIENQRAKDNAEAVTSMGIANAFLMGPRQRGRYVGKLILIDSYSSLEYFIVAQERSNTERAVTQFTFSLQAYRQDHGKYPTKLTELIPKYAAEVPEDIFSGKPPIYKTKGDAFLLYSVGENEADNNGLTYEDGEDDIVVKSPGWKDDAATGP